VRTGGERSKFGVAVAEAPEVASRAAAVGARIVGLHAHAGSGVLDVANWVHVGEVLVGLRSVFPHAKVFDLGGGLGVPDRVGGVALDLRSLDAALAALRAKKGDAELWLEPGRFVIAEAGVLLARVTQIKSKGSSAYVGVATGMNSLIRPALYGAHHDIVNLSRLGAEPLAVFDVVGPICETGDVLGHDRTLPAATQEGDVLLIATAGAYGASMASHYNLRPPAEEILL
jgi:diaminopimelate decarboxylase/aspartate kinase